MPEAKPTPGTEVKKADTQQKNDAPKVPTSPPPIAAEPPKTPDTKEAAAVGKKKGEEKTKAPDPKVAPAAGDKKPEEKPKAPDPKAAPTTGEKKPEEKPKAAAPKAAPAASEKKPEEKPKSADSRAAPTAGEKKPEEKPKAADPKVAPTAGEKKPEQKPKAPEAKVVPAVGEKKSEEKSKAPESKAPTATEPKKTEDKPKPPETKAPSADGEKKTEEKPSIAITDTGTKEIPIEPKDASELTPAQKAGQTRKERTQAMKDFEAGKRTLQGDPIKPLESRPIGEPKDAPAADPKGKNETTEPPKGVRITQVFEDRLEKPSQKDLESLPIPGEGEGFSMRLHPAYFYEFLDHPFSVNRETDDYRELFDSIKENGINEPIKARPREKGGLELISGHRRHDVAMQLNYPVPVVIVQADDDSARIEVVDGNLHRKDIPTSELARAAKMKLDAITRKVGRRSKMDQLTAPQKRSDQIVAEEMGYSRTQLTRLVRINSLVPEIKDMVDKKNMPFNVGVELSHLSEQEQKDLVTVMKREQTVPTLAQAQRMKEESQKAAKAAQEAAKAPKPALQVVAPKQPEPAAVQTTTPTADNAGKTSPVTPTQSAPAQPVPSASIPAQEPAPKPPAPVDEKKFASIMKNKPEPELKVIFTGAELKSYFPGKTPTIPEVKRAVFDALDLRKKALEKQAKKQEVTNPTR